MKVKFRGFTCNSVNVIMIIQKEKEEKICENMKMKIFGTCLTGFPTD